MSDSENNLQAACDAYAAAVSLITAMAETLQRSAGFPAHREVPGLIAQYDRILQGILLHVAIADGAVSEIEYRFIATITRYGDLLDTLNHRQDPPMNMTWEDFGIIPRPLCRQMVKICDQVVADTTTSFIAQMAHQDNTTARKNELEVLRAHTTTIMTVLSGLDHAPDGTDEKREAAAGAKARLQLLERPWNEALSYL